MATVCRRQSCIDSCLGLENVLKENHGTLTLDQFSESLDYATVVAFGVDNHQVGIGGSRFFEKNISGCAFDLHWGRICSHWCKRCSTAVLSRNVQGNRLHLI